MPKKNRAVQPNACSTALQMLESACNVPAHAKVTAATTAVKATTTMQNTVVETSFSLLVEMIPRIPSMQDSHSW